MSLSDIAATAEAYELSRVVVGGVEVGRLIGPRRRDNRILRAKVQEKCSDDGAVIRDSQAKPKRKHAALRRRKAAVVAGRGKN